MSDLNLVPLAFKQALAILGEPAVTALIQDLKGHDVFLSDPEISFADIMRGLKKILAENACDLIAERLLLIR